MTTETKSHAAPGLTPLARAHATARALDIRLGTDIGPLIEAMEQARDDALEEAACRAEWGRGDAPPRRHEVMVRIAATIRALKDKP